MRFDGSLPVVRRIPSGGVMALSVLAFALALITAIELGSIALALGVLLTAGASLVAVAGLSSARRRSVAVSAEGLRLDGALVAPARHIANVSTVRTKGGAWAARVDCGPLRPSCLVLVSSRTEATKLAAAFESESTTVAFHALPPWAKHLRGLVILLTASPCVLLSALRFMPPWVILAVAGLYALIALPAVLPQRIEVGGDGVFVCWFGWRRFVPFARVARVTPTSLGVALAMDGAPDLEICLTQRTGHASERRRKLLECIATRHDAFERLRRDAGEYAILARGTRPVAQWIDDMRAIGASAAGYRGIALSRERLWSILENAASESSAREGAALALGDSLDDRERGRLASALAASVSPRLRLTLSELLDSRDLGRVRVALEAQCEVPDDAVNVDRITPTRPR